MPHPGLSSATGLHRREFLERMISVDREALAAFALLSVVLLIGILTARDYGITTDEFIFDNYGRSALAWYTSGFMDRSQFEYFDVSFYGPWFQILVTAAQSLHLAHPFTIWHALTFVVGLIGLAAVVPIGRIAVGRWAGFTALVLCLTTGNLYGHLFFTPNDIPFLAAMTWATLAVIVMTRKPIPTWRSTVATGFLTGLAIATRFGGVLTQAYMVGALSLCVVDVFRQTRDPKPLLAVASRMVAALVIGWLCAIALWPRLHTGNPFSRFKEVYDYFVVSYLNFEFPYWGYVVSSHALPWHYIFGELAARLPEVFIALLMAALLFGIAAAGRFIGDGVAGVRGQGMAGLGSLALRLAELRGLLVVAVAALCPPIFVITRGSVIFDGLRHVLFIIPPLAVLAAWGLLRLAPCIVCFPRTAVIIAVLQLVASALRMTTLHPLEYVSMNAFSGGTIGAEGRFDLDYWSAAATEAVRNLEARLSAELTPNRFGSPHVLVCIGYRENMVGPMFSQPWIVETETATADYIIETERSKCGQGVAGKVIDNVQRSRVSFALTIERSFPRIPP